MKLPGYPTTRQGWDTLVKRDNWPSREAKGLGGPGGIRREYRPPPEVMRLIESHRGGEAPPNGGAPTQGKAEIPPRLVANLAASSRLADFVDRRGLDRARANALLSLPPLPAGSDHARGVSGRIASMASADDRHAIAGWIGGVPGEVNEDRLAAVDAWLAGKREIHPLEIAFCALLFRVNPRWILTGEGRRESVGDPLSGSAIWELKKVWPAEEIITDIFDGESVGVETIPEVLAKCMVAAQHVLGDAADASQKADLAIRTQGALFRLYPYHAKLHVGISSADLEHLAKFILSALRVTIPR